jgi:hypothetical protein
MGLRTEEGEAKRDMGLSAQDFRLYHHTSLYLAVTMSASSLEKAREGVNLVYGSTERPWTDSTRPGSQFMHKITIPQAAYFVLHTPLANFRNQILRNYTVLDKLCTTPTTLDPGSTGITWTSIFSSEYYTCLKPLSRIVALPLSRQWFALKSNYGVETSYHGLAGT